MLKNIASVKRKHEWRYNVETRVMYCVNCMKGHTVNALYSGTSSKYWNSTCPGKKVLE